MRESKTRGISAQQLGYMYFMKEFDARYNLSLQTVRKKRPTAGTIMLTLLVQTQVGAVNALLGRWPDLDEADLNDIPVDAWRFLHDHWGKMSHGKTSWKPSKTVEETEEKPVPFEFEGVPTIQEIGKKWLSTDEAAELMGLNPDALRARARKGLLVKIDRNRSFHGKGGGHGTALYLTESVIEQIRTNPSPKWRKILRGERAK